MPSRPASNDESPWQDKRATARCVEIEGSTGRRRERGTAAQQLLIGTRREMGRSRDVRASSRSRVVHHAAMQRKTRETRVAPRGQRVQTIGRWRVMDLRRTGARVALWCSNRAPRLEFVRARRPHPERGAVSSGARTSRIIAVPLRRPFLGDRKAAPRQKRVARRLGALCASTHLSNGTRCSRSKRFRTHDWGSTRSLPDMHPVRSIAE